MGRVGMEENGGRMMHWRRLVVAWLVLLLKSRSSQRYHIASRYEYSYVGPEDGWTISNNSLRSDTMLRSLLLPRSVAVMLLSDFS
jgi:hypothetical protein